MGAVDYPINILIKLLLSQSKCTYLMLPSLKLSSSLSFLSSCYPYFLTLKTHSFVFSETPSVGVYTSVTLINYVIVTKSLVVPFSGNMNYFCRW